LETYDPEQIKNDVLTLTADEETTEQGLAKRVMRRAPAYMTNHILQDNSARQAAFGSNSALVIKNKVVSAKTGTTNDLKDNWTVGYTPDHLVITWVGNNDSQSMSYLVSGVTGAAPIWNDIMNYILKDYEPAWQDKPSDVKIGTVCATGMPAAAGLGQLKIVDETGQENQFVNTETDPAATCANQRSELYWEESLPSYSGTFRKQAWIRTSTGLPPAEGEQVDDLTLEEHTFYYDPLTKLYCSDCNRPTDDQGKVIYEPNLIDVKNLL
jgi:membrane peptidoglycan carboxypeptidase